MTHVGSGAAEWGRGLKMLLYHQRVLDRKGFVLYCTVYLPSQWIKKAARMTLSNCTLVSGIVGELSGVGSHWHDNWFKFICCISARLPYICKYIKKYLSIRSKRCLSLTRCLQCLIRQCIINVINDHRFEVIYCQCTVCHCWNKAVFFKAPLVKRIHLSNQLDSLGNTCFITNRYNNIDAMFMLEVMKSWQHSVLEEIILQIQIKLQCFIYI